MKVCVIPARGGSKRIPRKNIRNFCGKPMIAWSIEAAIQAKCFDLVLVSTDDEEIASFSQLCGAKVPFMRPNPLANDFASTSLVIIHAIEWLFSSGFNPAYVCCLYATAPFVRSNDIKRGLSILLNSDNDRFVLTASEYPSPPQRALWMNCDTGLLTMKDPSQYAIRTQDLDQFYYDAGQFYWAPSNVWMRNGNIFEGSLPIVLPSWRVQDIDTHDDWLRAQLIFNVMRESPELYD